MIGSARWARTRDRRTTRRASGLRGRVLDWAWTHPRWKRRMREIWGSGREAVAITGLPRPFDPPEWDALRSIARTAEPPTPGAERVLFMSWRGWSMHLAIETVLAHAVLRRGGAPIFTYCGGRLPICDVMPVNAAPPMPCHSCREYASGAIRAAGFDGVALNDVLDVGVTVKLARQRVAGLSTVAECEAYIDQGLPARPPRSRLGRLVSLARNPRRHARDRRHVPLVPGQRHRGRARPAQHS